MYLCMIRLLTLSVLYKIVYSSTSSQSNLTMTSQLILNPDFEQPIGFSNWWCNQCNGEWTDNSYSGQKAFKAYNRKYWSSGPKEHRLLENGVQEDNYYYISVMVRVLNTSVGGDNEQTTMKISLVYVYTDKSSRRVEVVTRSEIRASNNWVKVSGDFYIEQAVGNRTLSQLHMYIHGPPTHINFIIDSLVITHIDVDVNWRSKAEARIEEKRKSNLTVNVAAFSGDYRNVTVKIRQLESEFGLGSVVDSFLLTQNSQYRDWFLKNFDWATLRSDMSWRRTEYSKNILTWEDADSAINLLLQHNKRVRGHMIHSSVREDNPDWIQRLESPHDLYRSCMKRVDDLVTRYRYKCESWDVVSEMATHHFLSNVYGSEKITHDLFKRTREVDYAANLFIDENNLLSNSKNIQLVLDQMARLEKSGAPVDGIGARAHFTNRPVVPLILHRLDRLAECGVSIWVTQYDYDTKDSTERADSLDDLLTALLSHDSVQGVMLSGFWSGDHPLGEKESLLDSSFKVTELGRKWEELISNLSRFEVEIAGYDLYKNDNQESITHRLYHGIYELTIYSDQGAILNRETVPLLSHQSDKEISVWV